MKRNQWIIAVAAAAALGAACTPTTECDYIDREVADPLHPTEDDIAYCWQGYDPYGLYAFRFERADPDQGLGNVIWVEDQPNAIEPGGAEYASSWSVDNNVPTSAGPVSILSMPNIPGYEAVQVVVNTTTMLIGSPDIGQSALRRAVCRGFGFETQEKQCRGSASRPQ